MRKNLNTSYTCYAGVVGMTGGKRKKQPHEYYRKMGISMPADLAEEIDRKRGLIPRAIYIADCLRKYLKMEEKKNQS